MSNATDTMAAATPTAKERKKAASFDPNPAKAGWLTKLVLVVICAVWLLPTIGTLITSFRPLDDAENTGWWTVLGSLDHLTLSNYKDAINQSQFGIGPGEQLRHHAAGDVHPDPDRGLRGVRLHVHGVPGTRRPVPDHRGDAGRAQLRGASCRS